MDPMDELDLMEQQRQEAMRREEEVIGFTDPIVDLLDDGDPGRGGIDGHASDGWEEAGANDEESFVDVVDTSIASVFDGDEPGGGGVEAELGRTDSETLIGEVIDEVFR